MKNYLVKIEFEYWTHGVNEQDAINRTMPKLMDDIQNNGGLDGISDITVKEIDENGKEVTQ